MSVEDLCMVEEYNHVAVSSFKLTECSSLPSKKGDEGLKRVACLELVGKWMLGEVCPRAVTVFLASSLKKCLKNRVFRRCAHIMG
jgi:hypothetical protein